MLTVKAKHLQTFMSTVIGLIGAPKAYPIYFQTRWGIHTFGMKFPIDVVILDESYHVVRMSTSLPPNRVFVWNPKHYHVLELPANAALESNIRFGEKVQILNQQKD